MDQRLLLRLTFFQLIFCSIALADVGAVTQSAREQDSELRTLIDQFAADRSALHRSYSVRLSAARHERLGQFYQEWLTRLDEIDFERLSQPGKVDWVLLQNLLRREQRQLGIQQGYHDEAAELLPFAPIIVELAEGRRRMERVAGDQAAAQLTELERQIQQTRRDVEASLKSASSNEEHGSNGVVSRQKERGSADAPSKTVANRASRLAEELRHELRDWHGFHNGYDPLFTWWTASPYQLADRQLADYATFLREKVVGVSSDDKKTVIGDPIGRAALLSSNTHIMTLCDRR